MACLIAIGIQLLGPASATELRRTMEDTPLSARFETPLDDALRLEPPMWNAPERAPAAQGDGVAWQRWGGPAVSCAVAPCTWERTVGSASDDKVSAAVQIADGSFVVVGNTRQSRTGPHDAWAIGMSGDGALLWHRAFGGAATDQFRDVVSTPDGGALAVGHTRSAGAGESDAWLVKLGADGSLLSERTFGGAANDRVHAAGPDGAGGAFVTGFTASDGAGARDLWVMRVSSDGGLLWSRTLGAAHHDEGLDVVGLADGGVAVTGHFWMGDGRGYDLAAARLTARGDILWQRALARPAFEVGTSLAAVPGGGLIVVGAASASGNGDTDLWVIRLDGDGNTIWSRTYGGARDEEPWEVAAFGSGRFVVAVETFSHGSGGGDIWLLGLGPDGHVIWDRLYGGVLWDHPSALLETEDGGLLLGGHTASKGAGFEDGWLLKLTADGQL